MVTKDMFPESKPDLGPDKNAEDERNIQSFLAGDREAFGALFKKYRDNVYMIAYRFAGNYDDAMEITQDVFLKAMTRLRGFKGGARFFTWIYRITVNTAIDFLRRRKTAGHSVPLESERLQARGHDMDPVKTAQQSELIGRLQEGMGQLSDKHRAVLSLHGIEQLSYAEIAQVLGCSIGTVMSRLFYARKKLAEIMGETPP